MGFLYFWWIKMLDKWRSDREEMELMVFIYDSVSSVVEGQNQQRRSKEVQEGKEWGIQVTGQHIERAVSAAYFLKTHWNYTILENIVLPIKEFIMNKLIFWLTQIQRCVQEKDRLISHPRCWTHSQRTEHGTTEKISNLAILSVINLEVFWMCHIIQHNFPKLYIHFMSF